MMPMVNPTALNHQKETFAVFLKQLNCLTCHFCQRGLTLRRLIPKLGETHMRVRKQSQEMISIFVDGFKRRGIRHVGCTLVLRLPFRGKVSAVFALAPFRHGDKHLPSASHRNFQSIAKRKLNQLPRDVRASITFRFVIALNHVRKSRRRRGMRCPSSCDETRREPFYFSTFKQCS